MREVQAVTSARRGDEPPSPPSTPGQIAVVDSQKFPAVQAGHLRPTPSATIALTSYAPDALTYRYNGRPAGHRGLLRNLLRRRLAGVPRRPARRRISAPISCCAPCRCRPGPTKSTFKSSSPRNITLATRCRCCRASACYGPW
ncbi:MAG: hypothetical protein WKG07_05905 [Hymenobacter sp.]